MIDKTAGLMPTTHATLRPFQRRIVCPFVYGSIARREEHARSYIDLLAIRDAGLADLAAVLRNAKARLGREINVTSYSPAEFGERPLRKSTSRRRFCVDQDGS